MADTTNKEVRNSNTLTPEARPTTGNLKSQSGFGRGFFGISRFSEGGSTRYEQDKEARPSTTHTKEALSQMS